MVGSWNPISLALYNPLHHKWLGLAKNQIVSTCSGFQGRLLMTVITPANWDCKNCYVTWGLKYAPESIYMTLHSSILHIQREIQDESSLSFVKSTSTILYPE